MPDVDDVGAAVGAPSITAAAIVGDERRMSRPTAIGARLELLDVGAADRVGALLVELGRVDAAHVVRLEDLGIEHGPILAGCQLRSRQAVRIARIAWVDSSSGDSEITVAGRSKRASASRSGSARSVPSP